MQVLHAFYIICLVIALIGVSITVYGNRESEPFSLMVGPCMIAIGVGLLIWGLTL